MTRKLLHDGAVYTLAHHLITCLMEDKDLDTEQVKKLRIVDFYQWLHERYQTYNTLFTDREEIEATYDVEDQHFTDFENMTKNPFVFCGMMLTWWSKLILRERPPKHKIMGICLTASIQFEPHEPGANPRAFQLPMLVWHPVNTEGVPLNTAGIIGLWRVQLNQVFDMLMQDGTDGIYEKFCTRQGEEIPVEFMPGRPGGLGF